MIFQDYRKEKFTKEIFVKETASIVRQFVEMRLVNDSMAKIFMAERIQKMPYARDVFENIMSSTTDQMVYRIQEGQKLGFLKSDFPPSVYLITMIESIFGYFTVQDCQLKIWKSTYQLPKDKEKLIQFITQVFTRGILI